MRFGPNAFPQTGVGSFLMPLTGTWLVVLVPVAPLLSTGIVLSNAENFWKSDTGISWMKQESTAVVLAVGQVMWVPPGLCAMQLLVNDHRHDSGCGHMAIVNWMAEDLATMVDESSWLGIVQANQDCQKLKAEKCWKTALSSMGALATAVKKERAGSHTE